MIKPNEARAERFLEEYEKLCKKHWVIIDACGCCDSPFLVAANEEQVKAALDHLRAEERKNPTKKEN